MFAKSTLHLTVIITKFLKMAKNDLIEEIVKIVLTNLRKEKGRLPQISNTCRINRGKLTDKSMMRPCLITTKKTKKRNDEHTTMN